ncbi:unnamed protein product [Heterobilharzia americana]|nr:unnamed protein product [Heterobilharzia americana]
MSVRDRCVHCDPSSSNFSELNWILRCRCHENPKESLEWRWCKPESPNQSFRLSENDITVTFHPVISWGTAVVRGTDALKCGLHYWELKAVSPLYGTDVMIGIGRTCVKLDQYPREFRSQLGIDPNTWGLSYRGALMHAGQTFFLGACAFKKGSIIGCLLDLWHNKLYFYVDGQLDHKACFDNLPRDSYYPLVCSTTLRSGFRLIRAKSYPINLQYLTCHAFYQWPSNYSSLTTVNFPSGLRAVLSTTLPYSLFFNRIKQLSVEYDNCQQLSCNSSPLRADSPDYFLWTSFSRSTSDNSNSSSIEKEDILYNEPYSPNVLDLSTSDILDQTTKESVDERDKSDGNLTTEEKKEYSNEL